MSNAAKDYLRQVIICDAHINSKLEEVSRLRDLATKITSSIKPDAVSSGGGMSDKIGNAVARIIDLENEINSEIDRLVDLRNDVESVLSLIKNEKQYAVLQKRYIQFKTWEQIAEEIGYSYYGVCKLHGRALQTVEAILAERKK